MTAPIVHRSIGDLRAALKPARMAGKRIAMVPTMGALHEGHLSLVERAREEADGIVAFPRLARDRLFPRDDLPHSLLDANEVVRRERDFTRKVVIEPVLNGRADGDLGLGIEFLDRFGHNMCRIMAKQFEGIGVIACDDLDVRVMLDFEIEIPHDAINAHGKGVLAGLLSQSGRDLKTANGCGVALGTVRQRDPDHGKMPFTK